MRDDASKQVVFAQLLSVSGRVSTNLLLADFNRSIDSMIRRLTKRTELEIVAQWPDEGDITDDATSAYLTSLLEDCSPDPDNGGKLSTRAPEELMRILVSAFRTEPSGNSCRFVYLERLVACKNRVLNRASFASRKGKLAMHASEELSLFVHARSLPKIRR